MAGKDLGGFERDRTNSTLDPPWGAALAPSSAGSVQVTPGEHVDRSAVCKPNFLMDPATRRIPAYAPLDDAWLAAPPDPATWAAGASAGTSPVLPVVGQVDAICARLVHAARLAGLHPVVCAQPEQALMRAVAAQAEMVLVQEAALQQSAELAVGLLRAAGNLRLVLVGPEFGSLSHDRALRQGYDEVWPANAPSPLLALMLRKAHGRAPTPLPAREPRSSGTPDAAAPGRTPLLQVDAHIGSCRWGARSVQLTRSSAVLLQWLQRAHPHGATRASLTQLLASLSARRSASGGAAGRQRRVDAQISRLRAELVAGGLGGLRIVAMRHIGYRLILPS